ncbi:uncharacterized protein LOC142317750 [Lycorma delicatula]|uniref:uncharacterized protein LOC142317750 n=1 Tax=Lycorma delicatula TaxID=130591 RepID=UPI003F50D507
MLSLRIAATLIEGARIAYSALKLPWNLHTIESPTCNIKKNSGVAKVLQSCKIIIWDERTLSHIKALEALDRTRKYIRGNNKHFSGALILLSGDFRQTLPVIQRSTAADELNACLKSSHLWQHVTKLTLTKNMPVKLRNDPLAECFAEQLLDIGDGKMIVDESTKCIALPSTFCSVAPSPDKLIKSVFPDIADKFINREWVSYRAIMAAKNLVVNYINENIVNVIPDRRKRTRS